VTTKLGGGGSRGGIIVSSSWIQFAFFKYCELTSEWYSVQCVSEIILIKILFDLLEVNILN